MFLLITFLFISLFNLNRFERNTNKMSNKNLLNLLLPENPLVIFIQKKLFPHWSQKKKTTSLFIITFHCFTVRVSNQLVFRVRRAAICPLLQWTNTITYNNGIKNIFDDEDQRWCFLSKDIGYLNSTYLVLTGCEKHEKMPLFNQVLREIAMVTMVTLIFWLLRCL